LEAQGGGAGVEGEAGGDVQQAVAQALGLDARELAGEQQPLGPADEVVGDQHERQPHLVVLEVAEGQVLQAGVLVVADVVLDAGASAVATLKDGDVAGGLVAEDRLEAIAVMVGEGELRAGVRRSRLMITREPCGQVARSRCWVISVTCPLGRCRWGGVIVVRARPAGFSLAGWRIAARTASPRS